MNTHLHHTVVLARLADMHRAAELDRTLPRARPAPRALVAGDAARAAPPRPARRRVSADTAHVPARVSSSRFVGREPELAELGLLLGRGRGRARADGVRHRRVGRWARRAWSTSSRRAPATTGARVLFGECIELGAGELPYAPIVGALRPLVRAVGSRARRARPPARAELAQLLPELGGARPPPADPATATPQARLFEALLGAARAARPRRAGPARRRGHPLGRPLDARLPRLPVPRAVPRARARRRDLPQRRAAPPPPAAAGHRRARALGARAAHRPACRSAARSWPCSWPTSSGRSRSARSSSGSTRAATATRCSPRSCSRPGATAAASCRRRCATR